MFIHRKIGRATREQDIRFCDNKIYRNTKARVLEGNNRGCPWYNLRVGQRIIVFTLAKPDQIESLDHRKIQLRFLL
jgi:hypothetical protein